MMQALRFSAVRRRGRPIMRGRSELGFVQHRRSRLESEGGGLLVGPILSRRQCVPQSSLFFSSSSSSSTSHDAVAAAAGGAAESANNTHNKKVEEEMRVAADMQALASWPWYGNASKSCTIIGNAPTCECPFPHLSAFPK
eukprot:scaffold58223_cov34-Attheya_sp.AAC.3